MILQNFENDIDIFFTFLKVSSRFFLECPESCTGGISHKLRYLNEFLSDGEILNFFINTNTMRKFLANLFWPIGWPNWPNRPFCDGQNENFEKMSNFHDNICDHIVAGNGRWVTKCLKTYSSKSLDFI